MYLKRLGKKGEEWIQARAKLIKRAILDGRIELVGGRVKGCCEECGKWKPLDPHHVKNRSQGGKHLKSNIVWICREDHMAKQNKPTNKKPEWQQSHRCKNCKAITRQFLCHFCGKKSV